MQVRLVDEAVEALGLGERRVVVVREVRVDLPRDVAVLAASLVPDAAQEVARLGHVVVGQVQVDLLRVLEPLQALAELLVVRVALRDRLLEDRRVRRHADDGVVAHHPRQLARVQELTREEVDPDALAVVGELVQWAFLRHW